jgi:hypothetical protein
MPLPRRGLTIRSAVVAQARFGFIYCADLKKEKKGIPHAITFRWMDGKFDAGECNYDAHALCVIQQPDIGLVSISSQGYYSVISRGGTTTGDILKNSLPALEMPHPGGFRSISEIGGRAHAVGLRGMVLRLDAAQTWTRIGQGLPDTFDIRAIHGTGGSDLYAVGQGGKLWRYHGEKWSPAELPTSKNLNTVKCAGDGTVYLAGDGGTLLRGAASTWEVVDQQDTKDDIWDLEWFGEQLYVSTMEEVYRLDGKKLQPVDFGEDPPKSSYQLSTADGVLWSSGESDILSFDGKRWSRVV